MRKNHIYYNQLKHQTTTMFLNRNAAKKFVRLFKNNRAELEQYFIYEKGDVNNFKKIDEDTIEKMFHQGSYNEKLHEIEKVHNEFKEEKQIVL